MPADKITDEQRASIIQNGMNREECALFFALFDAAIWWRHQMVQSNRSSSVDVHTEATDREGWATCDNANGRLIRAIDAFRDHFGLLAERVTDPRPIETHCPPGFVCLHEPRCPGCG